jgi:putative glutamine amidotransferase
MDRPIIGITADLDEKYLRVKHGYCEAVEMTGGSPVLLPPVGGPEEYAGMIDGLLVPGGDDVDPHYYNETASPDINAVPGRRSDFEISLLKEVTKLCKPVLGICYGMQLINVYFGGSLYQDIGKAALSEIDHKKEHVVVIGENRFLKSGSSYVNSTHHQAVRRLGAGLSTLAFSSDGLIEAFYKEDYNFLMGVQWHPERIMERELSLSLFECFIKASSGIK